MNRLLACLFLISVLASCTIQTEPEPQKEDVSTYEGLKDCVYRSIMHDTKPYTPLHPVPPMYVYDDPRDKDYNPDYLRQLKETFQAYLQEQVKAGKGLKETYEQYSFSNETLLMMAAYTNDMPLAEYLIGIGGDVNQRVDDLGFPYTDCFVFYTGETALHYAARAGNKQMYNFLIKKGANPKLRDYWCGYTPKEVWNCKTRWVK